MTNSTHKCEVVRIDEAHPIEKADRILRVDVFGGYPCVVGKADFKPGGLWCYIPPDSLVPVDRKEFAFLDKPGNGVRGDRMCRIKARKFRKQPSMGLLIPAPKGAKEGDDLADQLGVKHYQPPEKGATYTPPTTGLEKIYRQIFNRSLRYGEKPPGIKVPHYDIEALRRFPRALEGHDVVITEKVHGSNVCYAWKNRGLLHRFFRWNREQNLRVRSRTVWKPPHDNAYHCTAVTENVKDLLRECGHRYVLFGEVYGPGVQKGFDYGVSKPTFVAFDLYDYREGKWAAWDEFEIICGIYSVPRVPVLYCGKYEFDKAIELAEGPTMLGTGSHVREGIVVQSCDPGSHVRQLKCPGLGYYEVNKEAEKPKEVRKLVEAAS